MAISPEAAAFIRASSSALFATRSPKSRPFVTPLWFVLDRGVLYMTTGAQSRAGRNVAADREVTLLFGGDTAVRSPLFLRLRGRATCENRSLPARVLLRAAVKYYLRPRAVLSELRHVALWGLRRRYYAMGPAGPSYLKVEPTSAEFLESP